MCDLENASQVQCNMKDIIEVTHSRSQVQSLIKQITVKMHEMQAAIWVLRKISLK